MLLVTFRVVTPNLRGVSVFVTGDCDELGKWDLNLAKPLSLISSSQAGDVWSTAVNIASPRIEYRYLTGSVLESKHETSIGTRMVAVHTYEANSTSKSTSAMCRDTSDSVETSIYGCSKGGRPCIRRGWLSGQTEVHLRMNYQSLSFSNPSLSANHCHIKCIPVDLRNGGTGLENNNVSGDGVGSLFSAVLVSQAGFDGTRVQPDDGIPFPGLNGGFITFKLQSCLPESVAYKILVSSGTTQYTELGSAFLAPLDIQQPTGALKLPIVSPSQFIVGFLSIDFLVISTIKNAQTSFCFSMCCLPRKPQGSLVIGHRGMGMSYLHGKPSAIVRENTLKSMVKAAEYGADMVEIDIQLTRDLIPVVFHDFGAEVYAVTADGDEPTALEITPINLRLDELRKLKVVQIKECKLKGVSGWSTTEEDERPFPTLRQCFEAVDPKVGFNIEVKYCMYLRSGELEESQKYFFERNGYVDIIISEVLENAGKRNVIFTSFDPDVCTMLSAKQSRFPVAFLSQGETNRYPAYRDPRTNTLIGAIDFAACESLAGVSLHAEGLLRDMRLIELCHSRDLIALCWGEDLNSIETLKLLRSKEVDGIIYDRFNEFKID